MSSAGFRRINFITPSSPHLRRVQLTRYHKGTLLQNRFDISYPELRLSRLYKTNELLNFCKNTSPFFLTFIFCPFLRIHQRQNIRKTQVKHARREHKKVKPSIKKTRKGSRGCLNERNRDLRKSRNIRSCQPKASQERGHRMLTKGDTERCSAKSPPVRHRGSS